MAKEKRIVLVTGANKGIGFEVARQLARRNFRVFIGARNEKAGVAAVQKLNKEGEKEDYGEIAFIKIAIPASISRRFELRDIAAVRL